MAVKERLRRSLERIPGASILARLTLETVRVSMRYRVTGLASEAAFFMLLSLPPLILGLFGGVGYVGASLGPDTVDRFLDAAKEYAGQFLTQSSIDQLLVPTITDVLEGGRLDLISVGFLLSFWSGSRALNVFVDTIAIMYGQSGVRSIIRTRALSLGLYSVGLVVGVIVLPLVLLGPQLIGGWLPEQLKLLMLAYWPLVVVLSIATLTSLYHVATPRRAPWWRNLPGALLALAIWLLASYVVRSFLEVSLGGSAIYGPLTTPIVLLIWLYALAIAILIGAGLNAATRALWPVFLHVSAGKRLQVWLRRRVARLLSSSDAESGSAEGAPGPGREVARVPPREVAQVTPREVAQVTPREDFVISRPDDADTADENAGRRRDQQYERSERSSFVDAIERELSTRTRRRKDGE